MPKSPNRKKTFHGASSLLSEFKDVEELELFPSISDEKPVSKEKDAISDEIITDDDDYDGVILTDRKGGNSAKGKETLEVGYPSTTNGAGGSYIQTKTNINTMIIHQNHTNKFTPIQKLNPKKRAKTWVREETRALIHFRKEIDYLFNTSKSNKHLWETISTKMREKGFDRSTAVCTNKWRNLMKASKKDKLRNIKNSVNGSCRKKGCLKETEIILDTRSDKNDQTDYADGGGSKVDAHMQFSNKNINDASLAYGDAEHKERSTLNLETPRYQDDNSLAIIVVNPVVDASRASPWQWRETIVNGEQGSLYKERVITVKFGDYIKRVGIDATHGAIMDSIRSTFKLRTKRAFWLEDEDNIVRAIDRDMPLGNYTLHVDEGMTIKIYLNDEDDKLPIHTVDQTFYTEDDFRDFLSRRGWTCLRECNGCYRHIGNMEELCLGSIYRGVNQRVYPWG